MSSAVVGSASPSRERGLLAGEVASQFGIGTQTLHYYEREGLIPAPERSPAGYRLYTPALVERIGFIRQAQALGLSLAEIHDILRLSDTGACPCGHVQRALSAQLQRVDRRLRELQRFRDELALLVQRAPALQAQGAAAGHCVIVEHAVPLHSPDRDAPPRLRSRRKRAR